MYFQDRPATWLSGGRSILVQKNRPEQNYPLYTVNVNKWLNKQERAINYFEELHNEFPFISQYDVRKNNLVFTTREGEQYKIYLAQIYGPDIDPYKSPEYALNNPRENGGLPGSVYWITGGAVAAGVATYFLITELSGDEETTIQSIPIGRPPSMP
ncbi:MAG: hypothetical protein GWN00_11465 [Aliifodinibius sp.]|nr:hypothetical protein [Fodinibius sp.]NIY25401.1 hypothetical protein [Fodinibius sp.]